MQYQDFPTKATTTGRGEVTAIVSAFGNIDRGGDRVMPGAFQRTIADWKASGDPMPVIFSHDWGDPFAHIGVVEDLEETDRGLKATYRIDLDNPVGSQVFRLLQRKSLREHSFGYEVVRERTAQDGANELLEVSLIEIGPTLKGMNPATEVLSVKAALDDLNARKAQPIFAFDAKYFDKMSSKLLDLGNRLRALDPDIEGDEPEIESVAHYKKLIAQAMGANDVDDDLESFKGRIERLQR